MLSYLRLENVGPAPRMAFDFAPRLNLLTGDNGLGKSFVLDVAWWALTRTWARRLVIPTPAPAEGRIEYAYTRVPAGDYEKASIFDRRTEVWPTDAGRPAIPGLVVYAQVDGGFSVWDPARNYWREEGASRPSAYLFSPDEVWDGNAHCEGLIRDWASWQRERNGSFAALGTVLKQLSPSEQEQLTPGGLRRISLDDPKDYPTLHMPYGQDVAVVHASAGMRRIIALSYLLVWALQEHRAACQLAGRQAAKEIVFLIDEVEAHLHPRWQRSILPALLAVMDHVAEGANVQALVATHSPLVLASMEDSFDEQRDQLYDLELTDGQVEVRRLPYEPLGTADDWLTSDAIGLRTARGSVAQEQLLTELAEAWNDPALTAERYAGLTRRLRESSLPAIDPVRSRWMLLGERRGWAS